MPFSNPIAAGNVLIRPALQSPNYVAGVSGWTVNHDGTVEFNAGTFRGQVQIGTAPGARIILANSSNGDALDIYNGSNVLVYNITNNGDATSYNPANTLYNVSLLNAETSYGGPNGSANTFYNTEDNPFISSSRIQQVITQVVPGRGANYQLTAYGGSADATKPPTLVGTERGVTGSLAQSDQVATNNVFHAAIYTINTDANGDSTFNHGASFTPTEGFLVGLQNASHNPFYQYGWYSTPFSSTTAHVNLRNLDGTVYANVTGASVMGLFFG